MKTSVNLFLGLALLSFLSSCSGERVNLALFKAAYASSSYDYNLTAQLSVDGVKEGAEPAWLSVSSAAGDFPRREKEWTLDGGPFSKNSLYGETDFLDYRWSRQKFSASCLRIVGRVFFSGKAGGWSLKCSAGNGDNLYVVAQTKGAGLPSDPMEGEVKINDPNKESSAIDCRYCPLTFELPLSGAVDFSHLRLDFHMEGAVRWDIFSVDLTEAPAFGKSSDTGPYYSKEARGMNLLPSETFTSAWMSADSAPQWIYVDLGRKKSFSALRLSWIHRPQTCYVEISDNAQSWKRLASMPSDSDYLRLRGKARYLRLFMEGADESGHFALSEIEIFGKDSLHSAPQPAWKLCRSSFTSAGGEELSSPSFKDEGWLPAVVPGTVLYSYIAAGAVPDPSVGDNMNQISESYFNSDFWYRGVLPSVLKSGARSLLCFDGINSKAEVFMNGSRLGTIEGAFKRAAFDVTSLVRDRNYIAVHVIKPAHFGAVKEKNAESPDFNGGMLGADNPTFHASVGWDWIPTVRGRETGIWNDVHIDNVGEALLSDPLLSTSLNLPDTLASMTFSVDVKNLSSSPLSGELTGCIDTISFSKKITLGPSSEETFTFAPDDFPELKDRRLALWWPVGYGKPVLHDASFKFVPDDGSMESHLGWKAGIREFDYKDESTSLKIYVNGHRLTPKGGNWGFSEYNLRFRAEDYDKALALHKEMNFNMIRNWVGQTGDDEFYEACDKYGVVVWQDFWLANPSDGPDPDDQALFMDNARDLISRIRRHPSVGLYCGRNEGYPPASLDSALSGAVSSLHPGILYIPNSAEEGVSGHGPYCAVAPDYYFEHPADKFHSERGMPSIPVYESLRLMLTPEHLWKPDDVWGQHDFTRTGAQGDTSLLSMLRRGFGDEALSDAETFSRYAQLICFNGYRAMFEANNIGRHGLLLWMSHSAWPSLAWQTYDWRFTRNGAFYGAALGAEPVHIQFNPSAMKVQAVNTGIGDHALMEASVKLLEPSGLEKYAARARVDLHEDETIDVIDLSDVPEGPCIMILSLTDASGREISHNEYFMNFKDGRDCGDYRVFKEDMEKSSSKILSNALEH